LFRTGAAAVQYPPEDGPRAGWGARLSGVNSPHHVERAVLLPSSEAWSADAHLVGEALRMVGSAAAVTLDGTRYVLPTLTWQIAAEMVGDCVTADHRPEKRQRPGVGRRRSPWRRGRAQHVRASSPGP
jgi:hypothetical protein